jgi:hypothetical protein
VKIVGALAQGRVIVTTSIGSQGLDSVSADALIVRDDDASLAAICVHLLRNSAQLRVREAKARQSVLSMATWDEAAEKLASCWLAGVPEKSRMDAAA